jgi:RHS repeat-associated protein
MLSRARLFASLFISVLPILATAQDAPTGEHYAGRPSDAEYEGAVNAAGGYSASVPLDFPAEHSGLSVPVSVLYTGRGAGAAGLGWSLPMSYVQVRSTLAWRRPIGTADVAPVALERFSLALNGQTTDLVQTDNGFVPRNTAPVLRVVKQDANTWIAYDGAGHTYSFSTSVGGTAGAPMLAAAGIFPLQDIAGPGNSRMHLEYAFTSAASELLFGIDLTTVSYNPHPTTAGCYKNTVNLTYERGVTLGLGLVNDRFLLQDQKLQSIEVKSRADCIATPVVLRRYAFVYKTGGDTDTHVPRLESVRMFGRSLTDEATVALPIARYTYGSATRNGVLVYTRTRQLPPDRLALSGLAFNNPPGLVPGGSGFYSVNRFNDFTGDGVPDLDGVPTLPTAGVGAPVLFRNETAAKSPDAVHSLSDTRFGGGTASTDLTWRQSIDVNGDGRLDIIDATEVQHAWVVYLNTPSDASTRQPFWIRRVVNVDSLNAQLRATGLWGDVNYTPLSRRRTVRLGSEVTITQWKFVDVNGDGYPDILFVAPDDTIKAMFNTAGTRLLATNTITADQIFSAPVNFLPGETCGVENWHASQTSGDIQVQQCGFIDVNGDGILDRISGRNVSLGMAKEVTHGSRTDYFSDVLLVLPDLLSYQNPWRAACSVSHFPGTLVSAASTLSALRDINGDGLSDFVRRNGSTLEVAFGTGLGFTAFVPTSGASSSLSEEFENCEGDLSVSLGGLVDLNADGKPDFFSGIAISELLGSGGVPGAPEAGRLIQIDNDQGAQTVIQYASAKTDTSTLHQLPFPEIVVSSVKTNGTLGFGGTLAEIRYAYGEAEQYFDSVEDRFTFPGYRVKVDLHLGDVNAKPSATVTTAYPLTLPAIGMTRNDRFGRYLRVGRTRDVYKLVDNPAVAGGMLGTDPVVLLKNFTTDSGDAFGSPDVRIIERTHYDWDTRFVAGLGDSNDPQFCWDMVAPYSYEASKSFDTGQGSDENHANFDICRSRGFLFEQSVRNWRTRLRPSGTDAQFATANVETRSEILEVDDLGRMRRRKQWNDINVADDDVCVEMTYAQPVTSDAKMLFAAATRKLTDCGSSAVPLAQESWEYDTLAVGSISNGFVTAHNTERRDTSGRLLSTVRDFDATWDVPTGNPTMIVTRRNGEGDDGASRTSTVTYEPFGLAIKSLRTDATNGDGTSLPTLNVTQTLDALTLDVLTTTDANGTLRATTYDGFARPLLTEIQAPGGTLGVLSAASYLGFTGGDAQGRRVVHKVFTDPVAPANVATAPARVSTTFLDELARTRRTEVALGADYANQKLIVDAQIYDGYGRVLFAADTFPSTQDFATAYGTTRFFDADGTPSCAIRGHGLQPLTQVVDESVETYPTCLRHSFENRQELFEVRDANALRRGDASDGALKRARRTAAGRIVSLETWQVAKNVVTTRKEHSAYTYDRLGRLAMMSRFLNANQIADTPLNTVWKYDSLGQLMEMNEPDSAAQTRAYSSWGELTQVSWCDTKTSPCTDRRIVSRFDALGRIVHSETQDNAVVDAATINDYSYDRAATFITRLQPTNVLGRLASASSSESRVALSYDATGRVNARGFDDRHGNNYMEKTVFHGDGSPAQFELLLPDRSYLDERVDYTYDSAGRPRSVRYTDGTVTQDLFVAPGAADIDALGRIRQANYGGALFNATYAETGRRLLSTVKVTSADAAHSREISFVAPQGTLSAFDALGRERSRREIKDGDTSAPTIAFTYDALGQLLSAVRSSGSETISGLQFSYDSLGNLLQQADLKMSYQTVDRDRICSISYDGSTPAPTCNVKYDGAGSIIEMPTRTKGKRMISYFADGRVKTIIDGSLNVSAFKYDAFGQLERFDLFSTYSPDTRHDRHFGDHIDKHDEVIDGAVRSVITRKFIAPGLLATRHGPAGGWTFAFGEMRGNRFFTNERGEFVQDVEYQPYGEVIATSSVGAAPGSPQYTSAQWNGGDALTALGLTYLGARMYDPLIGRFLSRDPLFSSFEATKANPYAFAGNDPINASDPTGLAVSTGSKEQPVCTPAPCTTEKQNRDKESQAGAGSSSTGGNGNAGGGGTSGGDGSSGGGRSGATPPPPPRPQPVEPWGFGSDGSLDTPGGSGCSHECGGGGRAGGVSGNGGRDGGSMAKAPAGLPPFLFGDAPSKGLQLPPRTSEQDAALTKFEEASIPFIRKLAADIQLAPGEALSLDLFESRLKDLSRETTRSFQRMLEAEAELRSDWMSLAPWKTRLTDAQKSALSAMIQRERQLQKQLSDRENLLQNDYREFWIWSLGWQSAMNPGLPGLVREMMKPLP